MNLELVPDVAYPTHTSDAEVALLAAAFTGHPAAAEALDLVTAEDFYQPKHAAVWEACMAARAAGERIDAAVARVPAAGRPFIADLITTEAHPTMAPQYARAIAEAATRRRIVDACEGIRHIATTAHDADTAASEARRRIDEATIGGRDTEAGVDVSALLDATIDALDGPDETAVATGWHDLDGILRGGLRPGQLCVIGARPGVGKSVVAANLAAAFAGAGVGVHFASLEMTRDEVMNRMLANVATVDLGRLMDHKLTADDWERLSGKSERVRAWPLRVDDTGAQTFAQVASRARATARRMESRGQRLGLVVVDYLQLMAARDRRMPREQIVGENSEGLKVLAKDLRVPVVALAQVNRGPMDRQDKRPHMSDLRESGRIEADADHVWLLHRQDLVDPNSSTGILELHVAKNRNGVSGQTVEFSFFGHYSRAASRAWSPTAGLR